MINVAAQSDHFVWSISLNLMFEYFLYVPSFHTEGSAGKGWRGGVLLLKKRIRSKSAFLNSFS